MRNAFVRSTPGGVLPTGGKGSAKMASVNALDANSRKSVRGKNTAPGSVSGSGNLKLGGSSLIKNYIRKIVKEVLAEKEADQLFSDRETVQVIIKEFIVPGIKSMLSEYANKIAQALEIARYANGTSDSTKADLTRLRNEVEQLRAKLDGEVGKEVLKRLLS